MVEESRSGPMVLNMKGNTRTERSTVKAASPSQTAARTADRLRIMRFQELANIFGQMAKCMKANGKGTKCMAMECLYGATVKGTKDNLLMINAKDAACSGGRTVACTMACGRMVSSTASVSSTAKITRCVRASGRMAKRSDGSRSSELFAERRTIATTSPYNLNQIITS